MSVVREDVVKLTYDVDDKGMLQAEDSLDRLISDTQKLGGNQGAGKAEDGLEDAAKAAKKLGDTKVSTLSSGLDKLATKAGEVAVKLGGMAVKGLAVGTAATVAGVAALTTAAVQGYAEYEQLVGGVDTLFKDSSKAVQTYANDAYKTAGMSANEYMSTVTSFSASLIQGLGGNTKEAAEMANMAIIDMSDNANKMGTDMGMIQNAYQGFAKQNYTINSNVCYMSDHIVSVCEPYQGCEIQAQQEMAA